MKRANHVRMLKTALVLLLACALLLPIVSCTKPEPNPEETTGDPLGTDSVIDTTGPEETSLESDSDSETESEPESESGSETETRPEIILPTDPAEIVALIDSISEGSLENEDKIDLAYAAWAALSEAERAEVTNYDVLRTRLQELADAYIVKEYADDRIPHGQLILGVYYAHNNEAQMSDAHMQDLADAHVDMAWAPSSMSKEFLDMFSKYGMGVIGRGGNGMPVWRAAWMGEGYGSLPTMTPDAAIEKIPDTLLNDHPAIWGLDLTDEPSSNNFWWFEQTIPTLQEAYNAQIFSNMHPSYGGPGPLGTYSYLKYVRNYADRIPSGLMSYDFYVYAHYLNSNNMNQNVTWASFLDDLSIQSEACADTGHDLVVIMQLNQAPWQNQSVTLEQLKYQAYASMAFGNKYVVWANYARNWSGGWHDGALDEEGNKTQQYYRMKDCNADLVALSPIYMRYTAKEQTMLNADPTTSAIPSFGIDHPLNELGQKTITDLKVAENQDVLVGFYEKNVGEGEAFLFLNSEDLLFRRSVTSTVSFRTVSGASIVTAYVKGVPTILDPVDGVYTIEVKDADAVFVTVTEPESINAKPAPAAPIGQLTIAGADIGEFVVMIPNHATEREIQAGEVLVDLIKKATGKTLTVTTDDGFTDYAHYIYLGSNTTEALKADGYLIKTNENDLFITGNDAHGAGTLFGVYGFAEDYLGYRFYMADQITVIPADKVEIPAGLNVISNPAFAFREATFHAGVVQPYPLYQKYNGDLMYGDIGYAAEWSAGESLYRMAEKSITDTVCLSDENVYQTVLKNARLLMECDPDSEFLSCAVGQETNWPACPCEACTALTEAEGSPMALLLNFVNRLAADLAVDYPDLMVETLAVKNLAVVPATVRPADNVVVRIFIPATACHFHALNDASCQTNADICETLEAWVAVCDNVMVFNNEVKREEALVTGANLLTQYDTIKYLQDLGVVGYTNTGHDARSGELGELRNYLMSRLLWDADLTREEYLAAMDDFLKVYYGEGWTYIRQYIDKVGATDVTHADFGYNTIAMIYRIDNRDVTFMNDCIALFNAASEAATTDEHKYNAERSVLHIYKDCIEVVRDRTLQATLKTLAGKYGFVV